MSFAHQNKALYLFIYKGVMLLHWLFLLGYKLDQIG